MEKWEGHLDELKSLRDEINWRVKIAYTSIATFISVVVFALGFIVDREQNKIAGNLSGYIPLAILLIAGLISMFMGILNANHIIEKKIELYSLKIQRKIMQEAGEPVYSWLSFLYGYKSKENMLFTFLEKLFSASIGIFQYAIPNLLALTIIIVIANKTPIIKDYTFLYIIIAILVGLSILSSIYLGFFVSIINKEHGAHYHKYVRKFLDNYKSDEKI